MCRSRRAADGDAEGDLARDEELLAHAVVVVVVAEHRPQHALLVGEEQVKSPASIQWACEASCGSAACRWRAARGHTSLPPTRDESRLPLTLHPPLPLARRDCRCVHSASACCKDGVGRGGDSKNVYTQAAPGAPQACGRA